jgi:hypothetical protein
MEHRGSDCDLGLAAVIKDEARDLLAGFGSFDKLAGFGSFDKVEHWLANQPLQAASDGWTMAGDLSGWYFWLRSVQSGLQVTASAPDSGAPASWIVSGANDDE